MAAIARNHAAEYGISNGHEAADIGRDHLFPVDEVAVREGIGAEGESGVIHEQVNVLPSGGQAF